MSVTPSETRQSDAPGSSRAAWEKFWDGAGTGAELPVVLDLAERLQPYWQEVFAIATDRPGLGTGGIAELACGSRPVIGAVPSLLRSQAEIVWLQDGSANALQEAVAQVPGAQPIGCELAELALPDNGVSWALSQFGIEYGGARAFQELQRVLQPGALFSAVIHKSGGAIDRDSSSNAAITREFLATGMLDVAPELFRAAFEHFAGTLDDAGYLEVDARFAPTLEAAKRAILAESAAAPLAAQTSLTGLLQDMGELHNRFGEFQLDDICNWLASWSDELGHYVTRLESMQAAALGETELQENLAGLIAPAGRPLLSPLLDKQSNAYAWFVVAEKPVS